MPKTLNISQLRKLVINEVKRLREAPHMDSLADKGLGIDQFVEHMKEYWIASIEGDPAAEHVGHVNQLDRWTKEVEKACDELERGVNDLVEDIDQRLINGEFYDGRE